LFLLAVAGAITLMSLVFGAPAAAGPQTPEVQYSTAADFTPVTYSPRVCCKRGRHDWWTTQHACWRSGGYRVAGWQCRNDWNDVRVCCKRGRYDWWTSARACHRAGGYRVSGWQCRNG
jgi:hypothetical protein